MAPGPHTRAEGFTRIIDHVHDDATSPYDVVRFGPLDPASPLFAHVIARLRARGYLVQTYFNYPNWHANVRGMSSEDFLRARPRDFRRSIRRRGEAANLSLLQLRQRALILRL